MHYVRQQQGWPPRKYFSVPGEKSARSFYNPHFYMPNGCIFYNLFFDMRANPLSYVKESGAYYANGDGSGFV